MDMTVATPLLGGLSAQQFMRRHWQKKPLLVRQAMPGVMPPIGRHDLLALIEREEVESRLIVRHGEAWTLRHGPFSRRALPAATRPGWTLLVQGSDLHLDSARALLDTFCFLPAARLDDLMISFASDGGGVGPHVDSYDVFLLQVEGRRRWRFGRQRDLSLEPDVPLKILARFEPEQDWLLEAGDMLYLPPGWAHDGVAVGNDCITCSIGLRAPGRDALAREVLQRTVDETEPPEADRLYRDPHQSASGEPGRIPASLLAFTLDAVSRFTSDPQTLACALGEVLSEPKPRVEFEPSDARPLAGAVCLDRRSRMLYDERRVYLNGESYLAGGHDARAMRRLADRRRLDARAVATLSNEARELLGHWLVAGWLRFEA